MAAGTRTPALTVDRATLAEARFLLAAALGALVAFVVFLGVPYEITGFSPPLGEVWSLCALFALIVAPVVSLSAALWILLILVARVGITPIERRLYLLTLLVVAAFLGVVVSDWGRAVMSWWSD